MEGIGIGTLLPNPGLGEKNCMIIGKHYLIPLTYALHACHSDPDLDCGLITFKAPLPLNTGTSETDINRLNHCIRKQKVPFGRNRNM